MLVPAIKSAFDLADAASTLLDDLSKPPAPGADEMVREAQKDLTSYLFDAVLTDDTGSNMFDSRSVVQQRYKDLLDYSTNNGEPEETPALSAYQYLTKEKLIFFCDSSRFLENQRCNGKKAIGVVCDMALKLEGAVDDFYEFCFSPTDRNFYKVSHGVLKSPDKGGGWF